MSQTLINNLWKATGETFYMVGISTLIAIIFGLPLGIALITTDRNGLFPNRAVNQILAAIINVGRSLPFIILLIAIIPFTRLVVGTSIGSTAAIVPLAVAAIPFYARVAESALREVDRGLIEAAQAMGCTNAQIITKVLIPEAIPGLVSGATITIISLIGYSAMAGAVGGGGLGNLAITYGYQRFQVNVMVATVVVLVVLVQIIQWLGDILAKQLRHR
ncbi:ABC transporter permease [Chloroflexia bacterium SDU3-3]|nr:ABC transporter permease [Chloroflexia bacterium SDU3-3]